MLGPSSFSCILESVAGIVFPGAGDLAMATAPQAGGP